MDECFRCSKASDSTLLFDVISNEGIKKICRKCLSEENLPVIRKPEAPELSQTKQEERQSVYQRLSKVAGIDPEKHSKRKEPPKEQLKKQEELRKLTNERFREKPKHDKRPEGLKPYFHWALMRKRRLKKLSHKELAEKIREPEEAIKNLEQGVVPEDYIGLIRKIEKALEMDLFEKEFREKMESRLPDYIDFEKRDFDNITISDLKQIKQKKTTPEEQDTSFEDEDYDEIFEETEESTEKNKKEKSGLGGIAGFFKRKLKKSSDSDESSEDSEDSTDEQKEISQEDINNLVYRKKGS